MQAELFFSTWNTTPTAEPFLDPRTRKTGTANHSIEYLTQCAPRSYLALSPTCSLELFPIIWLQSCWGAGTEPGMAIFWNIAARILIYKSDWSSTRKPAGRVWNNRGLFLRYLISEYRESLGTLYSYHVYNHTQFTWMDQIILYHEYQRTACIENTTALLLFFFLKKWLICIALLCIYACCLWSNSMHIYKRQAPRAS